MPSPDLPAELISRILFGVRRLKGGPTSEADKRLRGLLAAWAQDPRRRLDPDALSAAAGTLRRRRGEQFAAWAYLLDALAADDEWAIVCARYRAGESSQVLARELGVSDTTVLANLSRRGVPIRRQGGATYDDATKARAVASYLSGTPARDVAAEFGTAKNVVIDWVRAAGGEVRRPSGRRKPPADAAPPALHGAGGALAGSTRVPMTGDAQT